jgi:hypothetical protein
MRVGETPKVRFIGSSNGFIHPTNRFALLFRKARPSNGTG